MCVLIPNFSVVQDKLAVLAKGTKHGRVKTRILLFSQKNPHRILWHRIEILLRSLKR